MSNSKEPFAMLYQSVIKDKRLTDKDIRVLAFIKSFTNWRVKQQHIARELNISLSTVIRSVNRLDAAGYLTYERKETKTGSERHNVKMLHKPQHWDEAAPKEPSTRSAKRASKVTTSLVTNDTAGVSELTVPPSRNDTHPLSNLTSYKETNKEKSYEERTTESYCTKSALPFADVEVQATWSMYNTAPEDYIQIDPMTLGPNETSLAAAMLEDMLKTQAGLQMAPGQKVEIERMPGEMVTIDIDARYYLEGIRRSLAYRERGLLPPKFAWEIHDEGYALFVRPDLYETVVRPNPVQLVVSNGSVVPHLMPQHPAV